MKSFGLARLLPALAVLGLAVTLCSPFTHAAAPSEDLALAWAWSTSPKISGAEVPAPAAPIADSLAAAVGVRCNGNWASGTAIAGAPSGYTWIITCRHVTDLGGREVLANGKVYPAELVATHGSYDLALMVIAAEIPTVVVSEASPGEAVTLKGHGVSFSFDRPRSGYVSRTGSHLGVSIAHGPGDSGGGYISDAGKLVGVLHGGDWNRGGMNSSGTGVGPILELVAAAPAPKVSRVSQLPAWGGQIEAPGGITTEMIITPDGTTREVQVEGRTFTIAAGPCPGGVCPVNESQGVTRVGGFTQSRSFNSTTVTSREGRSGFHPFERIREWNQNRPKLLGGGGRFRQGGSCSTCG